jgi:hypothetical protein
MTNEPMKNIELPPLTKASIFSTKGLNDDLTFL